MREWKTYKLVEIAELRKEQIIPNGIDQPYIGLEHIEQQSLRLNGVGSSNSVISNKFKFNSGDILYGKLRPYFRKVYQPKFEGVCSTDIYVIKNKKPVEQNFLYYLIATEEFTNIANLGSSGTRMPRADWKQLQNSEWQIPDLPTQQEIAQILSSLDDKIELNLQMNQTLEAMAQAIFKEWFVNFNFPGFDGELVDGLPTGWRIERFDNHFDVVRGLSYKGSGLATKESGIPMYNLNSVYEGGGFKYEGIKFYNGEYKDKHLVRPRDIIVANTEQGHKYLLIGFPAVVPFYFGEPAIFSHHIYRLRPNENSYLSTQFTYYLLLQQDVREQIIGCSNGTTVNMLKIDGLQMPIFKVPPRELIQQFSEVIEPIWQRQENNFRENQSLTQTRDTLLPKLMSGQIEIAI